MRTIHKFELAIGTLSRHLMDPAAKILACGNQQEKIVFWAEVDRDALRQTRSFVTYGTNWDMEAEGGVYLGTVMLNGGRLVFHAYEIPEAA